MLYFLGRDDDQVKVRGFRIELGEIESWAREHPGILHAAAWVDDHAVLGAHITLAVPGRPGDDLTAAVREFLSAHIPSYMQPNRVVQVTDWPLNSNGKTDKRALRARLRVEPAEPSRSP
ncbi:amino acid adenylation domain-containing protein [Phytoactinopolyspora limicola]|uniref:amino acid adenylation domain-containing protein n=1 Tax=Phytoactinopolyspora limicola TaxID=2715536 RepID=UPI00140A7201|nr:amino acid adenylation domain-containing protein [Phytoactinopolyspora limicola]